MATRVWKGPFRSMESLFGYALALSAVRWRRVTEDKLDGVRHALDRCVDQGLCSFTIAPEDIADMVASIRLMSKIGAVRKRHRRRSA